MYVNMILNLVYFTSLLCIAWKFISILTWALEKAIYTKQDDTYSLVWSYSRLQLIQSFA